MAGEGVPTLHPCKNLKLLLTRVQYQYFTHLFKSYNLQLNNQYSHLLAMLSRSASQAKVKQ